MEAMSDCVTGLGVFISSGIRLFSGNSPAESSKNACNKEGF